MRAKKFLGEFEELVLLAALNLRGKAYGVSICNLIEEATSRTVSSGALYTTLGRLEKRGLLSSRLGKVTHKRGGRAVMYYEITTEGEKFLHQNDEIRHKLKGV
jgi:PadR family transcriptional regulator PadR